MLIVQAYFRAVATAAAVIVLAMFAVFGVVAGIVSVVLWGVGIL